VHGGFGMDVLDGEVLSSRFSVLSWSKFESADPLEIERSAAKLKPPCETHCWLPG
jgi:hypothetical protein